MSRIAEAHPRPDYPFVARKLLIAETALVALVEADPNRFLEEVRRLRNDDIRCHIIPTYGFDIVVREALRIPIPAASIGRSKSIMEHITETGNLQVFVSTPNQLLETLALEIFFDPNTLLAAKGAYHMALSMAQAQIQEQGEMNPNGTSTES